MIHLVILHLWAYSYQNFYFIVLRIDCYSSSYQNIKRDFYIQQQLKQQQAYQKKRYDSLSDNMDIIKCLLRKLTQGQIKPKWNQISQKINNNFGHNLYTAKQCRQRYVNYTKFGGQRNQLQLWTSQQPKLLLQFYQKYGSQWNIIASFFQNKSENCLKNKFYGNVRKLLRKLNSVGKKVKRIKKDIHYDSVIRPLQATQQNIDLRGDLLQFATVLRQDLIELLKYDISEISDQKVLECLDNINKFNLRTRSFTFRKRRSDHKKQASVSHVSSVQNHSNIIKQSQKHETDNKNIKSSTTQNSRHLSSNSIDTNRKQQDYWSQSNIKEFLLQEPDKDFFFGQNESQCMNGWPAQLKSYQQQNVYSSFNLNRQLQLDYLF